MLKAITANRTPFSCVAFHIHDQVDLLVMLIPWLSLGIKNSPKSDKWPYIRRLILPLPVSCISRLALELPFLLGLFVRLYSGDLVRTEARFQLY